ncbi:peptidoglycan-associated lipoprotein Pal [Lacibacterium aquatile]|uniref:Peptidoglycan-associated lipoprotein n=1 Tax=Lacibacterium aquatile TaxID=1168082 RepID=A0ABW5DRE9_9PROT
MGFRISSGMSLLAMTLAACAVEVIDPARPCACINPYQGPTLEGFQAEAGDKIFFAYDKIELTEDARRTLEKQAVWLRRYDKVRLRIEGHADERGTRDYNLALGERRATAQMQYLVALGIDPNRIETLSYGKERPAVPGDDEAAWAQNRRGVSIPQI